MSLLISGPRKKTDPLTRRQKANKLRWPFPMMCYCSSPTLETHPVRQREDRLILIVHYNLYLIRLFDITIALQTD